jgi:RNA polymerase sigma-70 factor (ECF subfamily)
MVTTETETSNSEAPDSRRAAIERVFREQHGRAVAVLTRTFGDLDIAEEAVADAFATAAKLWPDAGLPKSPAGWIILTARNRALDRLRRSAAHEGLVTEAAARDLPDEALEETAVLDDQLRLIFTCCHPALAVEAQVALTLRLLGGLTTSEIARAFLVPEATLAQRLVRAKGKIRDARIPYRVPELAELPARLQGVLAVVYLVFNEGYAASSGKELIREDLCLEAIRPGRLLVDLLPNEPEALGLVALMLLLEARRDARTSADGELLALGEQDRSLWDRALIEEGQRLVRRCLQLNQPGPYQLQAAMNAVHSDARSAADTDWAQILALYDHLLAIAPSPIVILNRAVALAEVLGPEHALAAIDQLNLESYYLFHATRANLLVRLGRAAEARAAYDAAIARTENAAEQRFLRRNREAVARSGTLPPGAPDGANST